MRIDDEKDIKTFVKSYPGIVIIFPIVTILLYTTKQIIKKVDKDN